MQTLAGMRGTLGFLLLSALVLPASAGLQWENESLTIDAGPFDEEATGVFAFTNTGDTAVTIASVESSCGCTVPELDKKTYAPGESGELRAVFTFSGREGVQTKTILVTSDDAAAPRQELKLTVNIPRLFEVEPRFVVWRKDQPADPKTISIRVLMPDVVQLAEVESRDERFATKFEPVADTPGAFVLTITPQDTSAEAQASIIVKTTAPETTPRVITVYALVR